MTKLFLYFAALLVMSNAFAGTISVKADFQLYAEYEEIDSDEAMVDGWRVQTDAYGDATYSFETTVDTSNLPLRKWIGPAFLIISKSGLVQIGISVGDSDAGAETEIQLPFIGDVLLPIPSLKIKSSGGDYASGIWYYNAIVEVSVLE